MFESQEFQGNLFMGSGQTKADSVVTGSYPCGGRLRTQGDGVICAVPIPVLNV